MTIRISLGTVLAALAFIAIGAGTAVGVMLWEPWDGGEGNGKASTQTEEPTPTEPEPNLTATDAAIRAEGFVDTETPYSFWTCAASEFDGTRGRWIVECVCPECYGGGFITRDNPQPPGRDINLRLSVPDPSGTVTILSCSPSFLPICQ